MKRPGNGPSNRHNRYPRIPADIGRWHVALVQSEEVQVTSCSSSVNGSPERPWLPPQFMHLGVPHSVYVPQLLASPIVMRKSSLERRIFRTVFLPVPRINPRRQDISSNQEGRRATLDLKRHLESTTTNLIIIGLVVILGL